MDATAKKWCENSAAEQFYAHDAKAAAKGEQVDQQVSVHDKISLLTYDNTKIILTLSCVFKLATFARK